MNEKWLITIIACLRDETDLISVVGSRDALDVQYETSTKKFRVVCQSALAVRLPNAALTDAGYYILLRCDECCAVCSTVGVLYDFENV